METIIAVLTGLAAGAHSSTWGMYKDIPYEGFTYPKYFRSMVIGMLASLVIWKITALNLSNAGNIFVLFGFTYAIERAILEFYKTFLRTEDQSKYFIPMQFHIFGKVVESKGKRLFVGALYFVGVVTVALLVYKLYKSDVALPWWVVIFVIGAAGGWISAFGGAWKDAPIEGFELFKFFRSPAIAAFYAFLMSLFTDNYVLIGGGALGFTVASIETYKTFFFPSKPRGKFAGKKIKFPELLKWRNRFVPLYVSIWIAIIVTFILALNQPHNGLIFNSPPY